MKGGDFIKKILLLIAIMSIIFLTSTASIQTVADSSEDFSDKNVLFISSYSSSFDTFFHQVDGLRSVFDDTGVTFDIELMDSKRYYTDENLSNFYESLKYKLDQGFVYDVVIVGDDNALDFVVEHDDLFPTQPIVFLGINDVEKAKEQAKSPRFSGIYEETAILETVDIANELMPDARRVIAIVDSTVTGQAVAESFRLVGKNESDLSWDILDFSDLTFEEYERELLKISSDDIVLLVAAHRDVTGTTISFRESVKKTVRNLEQPVFTLYEFGVGLGLIGGEVVSYQEHGRYAAEITMEILSGTDVSTFGAVKNNTIKMFDYEILREYNMSVNNLPKDVIYVNREENVFLKLLPYILIGLVIIIVEGALILRLRFHIQERKKAEDELLKKRAELIDSNDELLVMNEEMTAANQELIESNDKLSNAVEQIEDQKKEIMDLIYLDVLTNLKNRRAISEVIEEWFKKGDRRYLYAISFLDVDNFKLINDTYGHDFGDRVIIETGRRLAAIETESIQIGRFGGDEFLIAYRAKDMNRFSSFLSNLENLFKTPFMIGDKSVFLTVSIGVAIYPIHGTAQAELIKKADMALYKAKGAGKNRSVVFDLQMNEDVEDKVLFQSHLRKDFENRKFYLNFQPVYDVKEQRFVGAEALIRWYNEELGQVSPIKLIDESEEMGLIVEIGKWVMEEAFSFAKVINLHSEEELIIAVNVSSVQLMHPEFLETVVNIIDKTGVEPENICLEVTETTLFDLSGDYYHVLPKIRKMGILIALDDFGTGYSSLSYFKNIPADILKIDKHFIDYIAENDSDRFTIKAMIDLAHHNDLKVIAEGVETVDQLEILLGLDCDIIQGYYYSKPLMKDEVRIKLLKQ